MILESAITTYIAISTTIFAFPKIVHKGNKYKKLIFEESVNKKKVINVCHRGSPRLAVENTISSFEYCKNVGDML